MQSLAELQSTCSLPDVARWEATASGLARLAVKTDACEAHLFAYGAQLISFTPTNQAPVLHLSPRSAFVAGKAIRGGIPLCFPWFGPHPTMREAPAHGFARTQVWHVEAVTLEDSGRVTVVLYLGSGQATLLLWPHAFEARLTLSLGPTLSVALEIKNVDDHGWDVEAALHSYFSVGDVRRTVLCGLEKTPFLDKAQGGTRCAGAAAPLVLVGETDRVYLPTRGAVLLQDEALQRSLRIGKQGSDATVVWNPWLGRATSMADIGSDGWEGFVCIEAACVRERPVVLSPGATHRLVQRVASLPARTPGDP